MGDFSGKIECQGKCKITNAHFRESSANIAVNSGNFTSDYNVFDFVSNQPAEYSGKGIMVYNSDKMAVTGTGNHKPCTTEQLKNPEYLKSIRFPIGVD